MIATKSHAQPAEIQRRSFLHHLRRTLTSPLWAPLALIAIFTSYRSLPANPREGNSLARLIIEPRTSARPYGYRDPWPYELEQQHLLFYRQLDGRFELWGGGLYAGKPSPRPTAKADGYIYLQAFRDRSGRWAITEERTGVRILDMGFFSPKPASTPTQSAAILLAAEDHQRARIDGQSAFMAEHLARNRTGLGPLRRVIWSGHAVNSGTLIAFLFLCLSLPRAITWPWRQARARAAARQGKCPFCLYDLQGIAGPICPECGQNHGLKRPPASAPTHPPSI